MTKKRSKGDRLKHTHGRGYRGSKHKGGSRGGVGRAGSKTHKRFSTILENKRLIDSKIVTNYRDLEPKIDSLISKGYLILKTKKEQKILVATDKFYAKYSKILSVGEPSYKYEFNLNRIKLSEKAKLKNL